MSTKKSTQAAKPLVAAKPVVKAAAKPVRKSPVQVPVKAVASTAVKSEKSVKAEKSAKTVKTVKTVKADKKLKVVRDSFTMPQNEYQKISQIKALSLKSGLQVKKSEVLRAGVIALCAMSEAQLVKALGSLDKIKTGRPNKH